MRSLAAETTEERSLLLTARVFVVSRWRVPGAPSVDGGDSASPGSVVRIEQEVANRAKLGAVLRNRTTHFGVVVVRAASPREREKHGVEHVAEERLDPALGAGQCEDLLEAAGAARPGEMIARQRILEVDRAERRVLLEADPSLVPALARLEGRPMALARWLEVLRRWVLAIDEQAALEARWIVDVDQLGMHEDGRLVFGHGRLDSAIDTVWLEHWGEREIPPSVRSIVQLPYARESRDRAAVKELALASMQLLSGRLPLEGLPPHEAVLAWQRGDWRVPVPEGAEAVWRVLSRALSLDAARRHEHVLDLADELARTASSSRATAPSHAPSQPARAASAPVHASSTPLPTGVPPESATRRALEVLAPIIRVGWSRESLVGLGWDRLASDRTLSHWLDAPSGSAWVERCIEVAIEAAVAEQTRGAGEDCARLDRAERTLEARGIVFRQAYGGSLRAGMSLVADETAELRRRGAAPRGMAFFDLPALEDSFETGTLEIYFAAVGGDPTAALDIGREVREALAAEGLGATWSGVRADPLLITPFHWHAPLCQSEHKLVV